MRDEPLYLASQRTVGATLTPRHAIIRSPFCCWRGRAWL